MSRTGSTHLRRDCRFEPKSSQPALRVIANCVWLAHIAAREFSEETAREIDCAVRELTTGAFEKPLGILRRYRSQLEQGAKLLLEKETLTREELPALDELRPAVAAAARASI